MAKSARSSVTKRNNAKLRASAAFKGADASRTERLSAKLLELASRPKEKEQSGMEVDSDAAGKKNEDEELKDEAMEIDGDKTNKSSTKIRKSAGVHKRRRKPHATISFPKRGDVKRKQKK